jgi:multiple sugar transport system ATP-binding protein
VGDPLGIYSKPRNRFVAGVIGSPAMNFLDCTVVGDGDLAVESPGLRVAVPPVHKPALERYRSKPITLGVRPEDIREATPDDPKNYRMDAVVEVVEPLGNEILLDVKVGRHPLVARVPPTSRVRLHEQIALSLNPERLHFFDTQTEQAIE